jgi:hypothetical protein
MTKWQEMEPSAIDYDKYIKSPEWLVKSRMFIGRRGYKCERCGVSIEEKTLFSHHLHYQTLGRETGNEIEVLCFDCHQKADAMRQELEQQCQYVKALNTYATKKYGEGWEDLWNGNRRIRKEFDRWLTRKRGYRVENDWFDADDN